MNLRETRELRGITQSELAKKLGVSQTNIYNYEVGRTEPNIDTLIRLSHILEVSVDYLVGNSNEFGIISIVQPEPNKEENELLNYFRNISPPARESLLVTARNFYELITTSKKVN